jgi:hypothetical protein
MFVRFIKVSTFILTKSNAKYLIHKLLPPPRVSHFAHPSTTHLTTSSATNPRHRCSILRTRRDCCMSHIECYYPHYQNSLKHSHGCSILRTRRQRKCHITSHFADDFDHVMHVLLIDYTSIPSARVLQFAHP